MIWPSRARYESTTIANSHPLLSSKTDNNTSVRSPKYLFFTHQNEPPSTSPKEVQVGR